MREPVQFSEREKHVIEFLIQGRSNKQIAHALGVSVRAVEFHLSNIYAKLGVSSRTEAALKLVETPLRESAGRELRESTVVEMDKYKDNVATSFSPRRAPMQKSSMIGLSILALTGAFFLLALYQMASERAALQEVVANPTSLPTLTFTAPTQTPIPTTSSKEHVFEQIRQLAVEYEQAIQSEKKNGEVEYSKDPQTGEDIFLFQGESYSRIQDLEQKLWENINQLNTLYVQIYRDELKPTPFPTQNSAEESKLYYDLLVSQTNDYCADAWNMEVKPGTILIYRVDEGKYLPMGAGDDYARCETYGQMIEEWRTAPILAKVNKDADMAMIRQVMGNPDLELTFQSASGSANAPGRSGVIYSDQTGAQYYVDVDTARLAAIEPGLSGHPDIPPAETKTMDELRGIARQFAATNSPRLAELESELLYEENCKGTFCFFRWDYRNRDWTGTDWMMMPPFLQVGVLKNGRIATYNNTLDLFE